MQSFRKKALILKKKTKLLYLVCIFMPSFLLLSNGAAADFLNIKMSQNGTQVAVVTSTNIYVYNAQTGKVISQFTETGETDKGLPTALPEALTFSTDARIIASAHGNRIYVWETATGSSIAMIDKHPDTIKALAFSPDSTKLATAGEDWKVRLWDVGTGNYIRSLEHPSAVNAVSFSSDGKILASAGGSLRLWDADTGERLHADSKDLGSVNLLIFSPDGETLASAGGWEHTGHLWDVKTGTIKKTLKGHTGEIRDIAFSPKGNTLVSVSKDKTIRLWDVKTGTQLKHFHTPVDKHEKIMTGRKTDDISDVKFSQDGKYLIVVSRAGTLHICNAETGRYQQKFFDFN